MLGSAKTLKRNNEESSGILNGPSMAPRFFEPVKFLRRGFFTHCQARQSASGPNLAARMASRRLNLGKSEANGKSGTYKALSGALSSV